MTRDAESGSPLDDYVWTGGNQHTDHNGTFETGVVDTDGDGYGETILVDTDDDGDIEVDEGRVDDSFFEAADVGRNGADPDPDPLERVALELLRAAHTGAVVSPLADELAGRVLALLKRAKRGGSLGDEGT